MKTAHGNGIHAGTCCEQALGVPLQRIRRLLCRPHDSVLFKNHWRGRDRGQNRLHAPLLSRVGTPLRHVKKAVRRGPAQTTHGKIKWKEFPTCCRRVIAGLLAFASTGLLARAGAMAPIPLLMRMVADIHDPIGWNLPGVSAGAMTAEGVGRQQAISSASVTVVTRRIPVVENAHNRALQAGVIHAAHFGQRGAQ